MIHQYVISDDKKRSLMDEFFETVTIRPKVSKMLMFEDIVKRSRRNRSMYRPGKNPRSHMRRGGGKFRSDDLLVDAHSDDAPIDIRRAATAFKNGGAVSAGVELDRRALPDDKHKKLMKKLLNTPSEKSGKTMAQALAESATLPESILSMSPERRVKNLRTLKAAMRLERYRLKKVGGGAPKRGRTVHIIMGLPGAGKSKLAEVLQRQDSALLVDSDEFKKHIKKEFKNGVGANAVHRESASLGGAFERTLTRGGYNMVMPLVGKNPKKMARQIDDFKAKGYKVVVHHVDIPVKFAEQRIVERFVKTNRAVPPRVATATGTKTRSAFDAIRGRVDGWGAYSAHEIPGRKIRYAVLGTSGYKLP